MEKRFPAPGVANPMSEPNVTLDLASTVSSHLIGAIAHDIRSPLTVIRGYLNMMMSERTGPLTTAQKECLEGALSSTNQLHSLAGMIGGASGLMEQLHAEVLNLREDLWRPVWREVQAQAEEKAIVFSERFPNPAFTVCGDRRILRDVIQKLIVRSVELANRNSELVVDLSTRKTGDVVLRILFSGSLEGPTGDEVASELLPLVFLHGGKVKFNARTENGSSFTLILPGREV